MNKLLFLKKQQLCKECAYKAVGQTTEEIGLTATELPFQRIVEPERAPKTAILKEKMIVRESSVPNRLVME